ncbi:MAG: zinc-ribbon domain-containing protein [Clostridia bacterium]|nr:zinc-ribbon domain-containing protein [Clostridia bacterium]
MKVCSKCQANLPDDAKFCTACGTQFETVNSQGYVPPQGYYNAYYADPTDHTAEFDKKDISDNKVIAMLVYLMGWIGIIIALIASGNSPYTSFHVRQALKFAVVEALLGIISILLFWTFIVPVAAGICYIILFVLKIICFFQICNGKAKEPVIISSLGFLK